jgi:lysophospholipase L1-like esterase
MRWNGWAKRALVITLALAVLFALGVSSAGANAARSAAKPAQPLVVKGNRVLLVGDSLLWQSINPVTNALKAEGWDPTITAAPGTTIGAWTAKMKSFIADVHPDVIVVELGTNNCVAACPRIDSVIDKLMRQVPRTIPVVWLNVQAQPTYPAHPESVNDALAAARTRWSNFTLVDMSARFRNHPEWHIEDGLHLSAAGSDQLGVLIAESLRNAP